MILKRIFSLLAFTAILASCSTKKNTVVSRAYHNLTARYNGYYYSCVAIDDGVFKIEKDNKDNFDKILPVYIYPTPEKAKSTFPEFDRAIKKSSLCIQKHAIKDRKGNEIASAGKWIDNNWINIGIAHFYKREYFSGIESFEYVVRTYPKSKDKFNAMIWLTKTNNEIGAVSAAEQTLSFLKNERHLPAKTKRELPVVYADYYMRRGQNTEAIAKLMEVTRNSNIFKGALPKKRRARYSFIIAQLLEQNKDNKRAMEYYKKTIKLKPNYEMIFYSKIKMARLLDVKRNNPQKTKKDLVKMTKEFKNSDYYDVIYYTLGEIEEKERNLKQAIYYYQRSTQTSVSNANQKALSFLKLGEINFDLTNYTAAEAYYDSTITTLPKDHPDYNSILARKKTLETLVGYIRTISTEDSLQRIAKMSGDERNAYVDKMIERMKREEERKQKEAEALKNANANTGPLNPTQTPTDPNATPVSFPFYNPSTVAFGVSDFVKKWGNRKLEDNWRRASKAATIDDNDISKADTSKTGKGRTASKSNVKSREDYLKGLPLNDSLIGKSNSKIIKAYYMMGSIYKEELNNSKKAIAAFEELNNRFPENKYLLKTYYTLYRTYLAEKNQPKADYYKNKILTDFPDSEFALLIQNPEYAQDMSSKKSEVEAFYATVYDAYRANNYPQSYALANEGVHKFGKNIYLPKFEFIRAMSTGKLKGIDTLEHNLKLLVAKYPDADVAPLANDVLAAIKKQHGSSAPVVQPTSKSPVDTFNVNPTGEHFLVAFAPDVAKVANGLKNNIVNFNTIFYSNKKLSINSNLFGTDKQLIVVKSFPDSKEGMTYYDNLLADPDVFKDDVKKDQMDIFIISADNLPVLYKNKNIKGYKLFFEDNYKKQNIKK